MNRYKVSGEYTISFDVEVLAESEEEAIEKAEDIDFWESANNGIFADDLEEETVSLNADGMVDNVVAECLEENVETDDDDDWDDEAY